jgi:RNA polymerase sigma-70 factor (ECF subfamily)
MPFFMGRPDRLEGFRAGRKEVLEELYRAYIDQVERIIRNGFFTQRDGHKVVGVRASEVADLVQDVFVRAFRESARRSFDGTREYGPFLFAIARNVLSDWGRRARRGELIAGDGLTEVAAPELAPDTEWAEEGVMRVVQEYLAGLPPPLRSVHEERYVRGHSQVEAAAALGLSRQQVRTLEQKLREGLARALRRAEVEVG